MTSFRVEIRKGQGRQPWRVYLIARNHEILSVSEGYVSRWNARRAARRMFPGQFDVKGKR